MGKINNSNATNSASRVRASTLTYPIITHFPHSTPTISPTASSSSLEEEVFYDASEFLGDNFYDGPDNLEDVFYDALDYFYEGVDSQSLTIESQTPIDFEYEGAAKGRPAAFTSEVPKFPPTPAPTTPVILPSTTANTFEFPRRPCEPATSPTIHERFPTSLTAHLAASDPVPREPKKKALLIGLNYDQCGKDALRLRHATKDARRFATTLTKLGYSSENMKVVVDEKGQPFASSEYLIEAMDWLVRDVLPGDRLFFMFSGHCEPPTSGRSEAHLVAADLMTVPRSTFQQRLISKVPAGAELTIVLDCCNAAGMVKLKYCIGKMEYNPEIKQTDKPNAVSESGRHPVSLRGFPQQGSLHGLKNVDHHPLAPLPNKTPTMVNPILFGTPVNTRSHIKRGVVGARPLPSAAAPTQTQAPGLMTSLIRRTTGITESPSPLAGVRPGPAQRRQLVVEGRPLPYFEERQASFAAPSGKIVVLAGSSERQKAFEASNQVENGIVTDAFCSTLEKSLDANSTATLRDLWYSVVGAIDRENGWRSERDVQKEKKPAPNLRVQCAQLLVSQQDVLHSSSPILNQIIC